jgi:Bacterial TSP3 repeat
VTTRKNTVITIIIGIIIILSGYGVSKYTRRPLSYEATSEPSNLLIAIATSTSSTKILDSDSDGLPDWEEVLWKTDPNVPDTDGDGTSDGEEVRTNHDPVKKGPDDALTENAIISKNIESLTATQKMSRDILTAYIKLKGQGGNVEDPPSLQEVITNNQVNITAAQYSPAEFKAVNDSPIIIQEYAKAITEIVDLYMKVGQQSELQTLQTSLEKEDQTAVGQLKTRSTNYKEAVKALLALSVPKSALLLHSDFTNTLSLMAEIVNAMSLMYTDPITSLAGLQKYQSTRLILADQFKDFNAYFTQQSNSQ